MPAEAPETCVTIKCLLPYLRHSVEKGGYFKIGKFDEFEIEREDRLEVARSDPSFGLLVDVLTARMLLTVYDALNEQNRARFEKLHILRAVDIGWKCVS